MLVVNVHFFLNSILGLNVIVPTLEKYDWTKTQMLEIVTQSVVANGTNMITKYHLEHINTVCFKKIDIYQVFIANYKLGYVN